jgi:hypothetical protein
LSRAAAVSFWVLLVFVLFGNVRKILGDEEIQTVS